MAAIVGATGCASEARTDGVPTSIASEPPRTAEAPSASAAPEVGATPAVATLPEGYPFSRLKSPKNPLEPLAFERSRAELDAWGVRSVHAASATAPRVWLIVLEFANQASLLAALPKIERHLADAPPPHYVKTTYTGAHLLVTGFPGDKPVSPEMEFARTDLLSAFAGEE